MSTRRHLADTAKKEALSCFHGKVMKTEPNIQPIISPFPKWSMDEADGNWCAAFVYYCCAKAGFTIPIRPKECKSCNLAGCGAWEEWAKGDPNIAYYPAGEIDFSPSAGDIVLFDRVFEDKEHDHIGIVVEDKGASILVAEGNINNFSGLIERSKDSHIRAYIRIPDDYSTANDSHDNKGRPG
ncbi:MAG: CHAP domain-containing protein [Christensenellales bacterium]